MLIIFRAININAFMYTYSDVKWKGVQAMEEEQGKCNVLFMQLHYNDALATLCLEFR